MPVPGTQYLYKYSDFQHVVYVVIYGIQKISFQVLHLQYGMYVWPCAVVLAQYLYFRGSLPGKAVLEVKVPLRFAKLVISLYAAYCVLLDIFKSG